MPSIQVTDYQVNYQAPRGLPNSDSDTIALLVHGAGGSSRHWLPVIEQLDSSIFPIAVDLPGHGATSGVVPNSVERVAEFLANFLAALEISRPICYVGQSLGGLIGLQFALAYPQQVAKAVIMATSAKIQLHPDFLASALSGDWDLATLRQSFAPEVPEEVKTLVLNEFQHTRLPENAADFMGVSEIDLTERVADIATPTLIITGDDDVIISPRKGKLLQKQLPDARLVKIPDAGHYLQVEQPVRVTTEIEQFLLGATAGVGS